jgi:hypothetical protein
MQLFRRDFWDINVEAFVFLTMKNEILLFTCQYQASHVIHDSRISGYAGIRNARKFSDVMLNTDSR